MLLIFNLIIYKSHSEPDIKSIVGWSTCRRVALNGRLRHASHFTVVPRESALSDH